MAGFGADQIRTGAAYEVAREQTRIRLAVSSAQCRVDLGAGVVLVFMTAEGIRTALEELLRAERVDGGGRVKDEAEAFGALAGGPATLAAVLLLDVADPAALADRLAELHAIAPRVRLDLGGGRVPAVVDAGDSGAGAIRLRFDLDTGQRGAVLGGAPLTVVVDHPSCSASVALTGEQVHAISADLDR